MQATVLAGAPASTARATRRPSPSCSALVPVGARLSARSPRAAAQKRQARQERQSVRVQAKQAAQAPPAVSTAAGDDSGVFDVVVVGAGISGLTTAQVRLRRRRGQPCGCICRGCQVAGCSACVG